MRRLMVIAVVAILGAVGVSAHGASLNIDTVVVGNPGNADDVLGAGYGGVDYTYNIGMYEVTAGQYTEFLNAVAKTDTYNLYDVSMWFSGTGCKIQRQGSSGDFVYSVEAEYVDRPVNYVSYWDACRFTNWLHNGQPTGSQDATTTEDGAYTLSGYVGTDGSDIMRNAGASWFIPSEDEWYKAAYYENNDLASGDYWLFATGSNDAPSNELLDPDGGDNANFYSDGYTIGGPYFRTEVGDFENSSSYYGTFDQAGNVSEWTEGLKNINEMNQRVYRGGSYAYGSSNMEAGYRISALPTSQIPGRGFRVAMAYVPEPCTLMLLAFGAFGAFRRTHR